MGKLSEWAERCYAEGTILHQLNSKSDITGLYSTTQRIGNGIPCYNYLSPVYHVWINDRNVASSLSYLEAYGIYKERESEDETDRSPKRQK